MIRECIHCKKSRGLGSDVGCSEGHPYTSYMRETECPYFEINRTVNKMKLKVGDNMSDRYTVINKEEPRGQSVAENGIPCTAIHCVTQLNGLFQDNEKLELKVIKLESKLKSIEFVLKCSERKLDKDPNCLYTTNFPICVSFLENLLAELNEEILEIIND